MENATKTYSSIHLRERDKILEEKHQKQLVALEGKLARLKRANDDTLKQLFDAQTRGNRLAESLGFHDIFEAQVAIDTADYQTPYKECFERIDKLQQEVLISQDENESLRSLISSLEEGQRQSKEHEVTESREAGCQTTPASCHLEQELWELQERYDALLQAKESAAARYEADYAKWRGFKQWLFEEEAHLEKHGNGSKAKKDKGKHQVVSVMRKKRKMMEIGPNLDRENRTNTPKSDPRPPSLGGIANMDDDKENLTPTPIAAHRSATTFTPSLKAQNPLTTLPSSLVIPSTSSTSFQTAATLNNPSPVRPTKGPSSSPSLFIDHSSNAKNQPLKPLKSLNQVPKEDISPQKSRDNQIPEAIINLCSSETEEDTQDHNNPLFDHSESPSSPILDTALASSQTEPDSQSQFDFPFPDPTPCPPRPMTRTLLAPVRKIISRDPDTLQPTKVLRLDNEEPTPAASFSTAKPRPTASRLEPLVDRMNNHMDQTPLAKSSRPIDGTSMKPLGDYSAYKGRGRYAQSNIAASGTINARFQIDTNKNGGLDFQYDEVVRDKNQRKRMHAGDCECCSDYYEAVGPLPTRLQAPLWKSPPTTPVKQCERHQRHPLTSDKKGLTGTKSRQDAINSHKQAISRHRHHWERPKTPPGYWNIGFPDTQEAEDINQRAEEMHRKKLEKIEVAATKEAGLYRRRP